MKFVIAFIFSALSGSVLAHEGHDHNSPTNIQAPKGGIIKAVETALIEVVSKGSDIKVYIYDLERKPRKLEGFVVLASAVKPKSKKEESIPLLAKETHYEASFDAKGVHRYTLVLSVQQPGQVHADKLKFTIEPHK